LPDAEAADAGTGPETKPIDPASISGLIEVQGEDQQLASELLGSDVADPAGEAVGEISDLILDPERRLVGVVISTGGFLGIGEHTVGVEMAQVRPDAEGNLYTIDWTRAEIEAVPGFTTLAEQEAEREAEALRQQQLDQQQAPIGTNQMQ
jgi:sporulation protein YlmC with PRC-barrel domain